MEHDFGSKGYLKNPIGKRKNRPKPAVLKGGIFLTNSLINPSRRHQQISRSIPSIKKDSNSTEKAKLQRSNLFSIAPKRFSQAENLTFLDLVFHQNHKGPSGSKPVPQRTYPLDDYLPFLFHRRLICLHLGTPPSTPATARALRYFAKPKSVSLMWPVLAAAGISLGRWLVKTRFGLKKPVRWAKKPIFGYLDRCFLEAISILKNHKRKHLLVYVFHRFLA